MSTPNLSVSVSDTAADPNPYIRTYAKDFAKLSGTPLPAPSKRPPNSPASDEVVTSDTAPIIGTLTQEERDANTRDNRAAAAEQEISSELFAADAGSIPIVSELAEKIPASPEVARTNPAFELQTIRPQVPIANVASSTPTPTAGTEERTSILSRLRSRAQSKLPSETSLPQMQAITPTPEVSMPASLPQPAPTPHPIEAPISVPTRPLVPPPIFTPPPLTVAPAGAPETPSPFHSYKTDFADRIDAQGANTFSVIAAENDARKIAPVRQKKGSLALILAGTVLIIGATGGIVAAYLYMQSVAPVALTSTIPSLITPDKELALTSTDPRSSFLDAVSEPLPDGNVLVTYIAVSTTTSKGKTTKVPESGGALLQALNLPAPSILLRNIDPSSTVGIVHAGDETGPFFLLRVTSYERTFAGMLDWETTMGNDLAAFYPAYAANASGTPATVSSQFTDETVASHPVRVLQDSNGRSLMLYGYTADKQTLIIARNEQAFTLLSTRLATGGK